MAYDDMDWIGVTVVQYNGNSRPYLFEMPAWYSDIKEGNRVVCRTENGFNEGTVVFADTVEPGSQKFDMLTKICNATLPLKRIESVYMKVTYKDEKESDDNA